MSEQSKDSLVRLQTLYKESEVFTSSKSLFSQEFQKWHADAISTLLAAIGIADSLTKDFKRIDFEPFPEMIKLALSSMPAAHRENTLTQMRDSHFLNAMDRARELLGTAIYVLSRRGIE